MKKMRATLHHSNASSAPESTGVLQEYAALHVEAAEDSAEVTLDETTTQATHALFMQRYGIPWETFHTLVEHILQNTSRRCRARLTETPVIDHAALLDRYALRQLEKILPVLHCKICVAARCDAALEPCGHVVCTACSRRLEHKCPFCAKSFVRVRQLYFS